MKNESTFDITTDFEYLLAFLSEKENLLNFNRETGKKKCN